MEYALAFDRDRKTRLLIVPALFDEGNKLRRLTVEIMRRLDGAGFDCFLPDLPGCNESTLDLATLGIEDWQDATAAAARYFSTDRVLAIRGGGLIVPPGLRGWRYAPVNGASLLKTLFRSRVLSAREAGRDETVESLLNCGLAEGLELAGYRLSGSMLRQMQNLVPTVHEGIATIEQSLIGGAPLWLRAEPDYDARQADALAAVVALGLAA